MTGVLQKCDFLYLHTSITAFPFPTIPLIISPELQKKNTRCEPQQTPFSLRRSFAHIQTLCHGPCHVFPQTVLHHHTSPGWNTLSSKTLLNSLEPLASNWYMHKKSTARWPKTASLVLLSRPLFHLWIVPKKQITSSGWKKNSVDCWVENPNLKTKQTLSSSHLGITAQVWRSVSF